MREGCKAGLPLMRDVACMGWCPPPVPSACLPCCLAPAVLSALNGGCRGCCWLMCQVVMCCVPGCGGRPMTPWQLSCSQSGGDMRWPPASPALMQAATVRSQLCRCAGFCTPMETPHLECNRVHNGGTKKFASGHTCLLQPCRHRSYHGNVAAIDVCDKSASKAVFNMRPVRLQLCKLTTAPVSSHGAVTHILCRTYACAHAHTHSLSCSLAAPVLFSPFAVLQLAMHTSRWSGLCLTCAWTPATATWL